MKKFPSVTAVLGAWLCAFGFVLPGVVCFLIGSAWAIIVDENTDTCTILFAAANLFAFLRLIGA